MIGKINSSQMQDIVEISSSKQSSPNEVSSNVGPDVSLQFDYVALIDKAMQSRPADTKAVEYARELLLSGQLESPENIQAAAEEIINYGI